MNSKISSATRVLRHFSFAASLILIPGLSLVPEIKAQDYGRGQQPQYPEPRREQPAEDAGKSSNISSGERQALEKIRTATDNNVRLQAAGEFVKKYPKSTMRKNVIGFVAAEIGKVEDPNAQISLAEKFTEQFKDPADTAHINRVLVDAYVKVKRLDDAFKLGQAELSRAPEDIHLLTQLALAGTEQVKARNAKYVAQTAQYAAKAIEVIEADKKPETLDAAQWGEYKTRWLGALYQSAGIVSFVDNKKEDARAKLEKASTLNGQDPVAYMLLGSIINEEYEVLAKEHQATPSGPAREDLLKKAHAKMDQVIDLFARTVALSDGRPGYQQLHDQILENLQGYYRYRHDGSTEGLKELIQKYKPAAKAP